MGISKKTSEEIMREREEEGRCMQGGRS